MNKLDFCKKCKKRKFDTKQGVVCSLTNEKPAFEDNCPDFENDAIVKEYKGLKLKPNAQRAKILLTFIWIVLGLEVISLISSGLQYDLLQIIANGGEITNDAATANDLREKIIAILYMIAYVISGVLFIMWFRRAYFNLHQKVQKLSFDEGWAAGCWFVPFVNLYRPFQIMKELYEETRRIILDMDNTSQIDLTTNFLGLWWTLWIANGILGQIIYRLSSNANTLPELQTGTIFDIIGEVLGVGLCIVTIKIIKSYSEIEGLLETED
ncbi:DUF4328 domain-containing protein [Geofilum sp. OHC36d9]|uniref:DUF4328 domain-containing protein n=1 Tax=Geofilum sp. OHC36d9 TaxID=3458413 RepID=UPI0040348E7C